MKILILEDYSGLGRLLKEAFERNGCEVSLVASRQTLSLGKPPDYILTRRKTGMFSKLEVRLRLLKYLLLMPRVSVVLILNQSIIFQGLAFLILTILQLKSDQRFLSVCGLDSVLVSEKIFKELPGTYDKGLIDKDFVRRHQSKSKYRLLKKIVRISSGVIPISHSFHFGWNISEFKDKVLPPIGVPFPCEAKVLLRGAKAQGSGNVTAVHFSSRADKGTELISKAFEKINLSYGEKFKAKINERMDIEEFLDELWQNDIFVDRVTGSTYGTINSLIALSMGKIVITKVIPEELSAFGITQCPVVMVNQNTSSIVTGLEEAFRLCVSNKADQKENCIKFLQTYHNPEKIGARYLEIFSAK